jgi:hypothetical protein
MGAATVLSAFALWILIGTCAGLNAAGDDLIPGLLIFLALELVLAGGAASCWYKVAILTRSTESSSPASFNAVLRDSYPHMSRVWRWRTNQLMVQSGRLRDQQKTLTAHAQRLYPERAWNANYDALLSRIADLERQRRALDRKSSDRRRAAASKRR